MKLLRKKNGQWFTVSVAIGGMLLGATTINAAASETDVHSDEVNVSGEAPPENLSGDYEGQTLDQTVDQGSQVEGKEVFEAEEPTYIVEENLANDQADNSKTPSLEEEVLDHSQEPVVDLTENSNDQARKEPTSENVEQVGDKEIDIEPAPQPRTEPAPSSEEGEPSQDASPVQDGQANLQEASASDSPSLESAYNTSQVVELEQESTSGQSDVPSVESPDTFRNELVNVRNTWSEGYRGEGQVVAIIDSGLFYDHRAFQGVSDLSRAYYQSEEELNQAKEAAGIDYGRWINDKVVFAYNYNDLNSELVEDDYNSHGTHVADSAVGNPASPLDIGTGENSDAKMYVQGVAPEAQLMFMRVFSDLNNPGATGEFLYVQAIRDAVALGAQSINLSLGAPGGSQYNTTGILEQAIADARRQGVSVVIAAGNEDSFGSGHNNPLVENPDYGIVGSPSTSRDSISVAAVDSLYLVNDVLSLSDAEGNVINLRLNVVSNGGQDTLESPEYANTAFEYEYVGLGTAADFVGVDLTGKFALISRGQTTFTEKAQNARNAGAVGAIIFNNVDDGTLVNIGVDGLQNYPIIGVNYAAGQVLIENQDTHRVNFAGETLQFANPNAGNLTNFTSWGLSADGELKPDLAAPGGNVYGAVNNDDYANMSGTSMASPHVAGAVALLNQKLPDLYEGLEGQELSDLVKALLMSTARPHYNQERGAYTSPRQQGAGLIDVDSALSAGLYLTGADQYPSISLRNVGDRFEFDVYVYNISDQDRTLDVTTHLATDAVTDTLLGPAFALEPRHLKDVPERQIFVAANSHEVVTISVDAREFTEALLTEMPNGYFLEGFVSFGSAEDPLLASIPFVGFRGDFANLDVVERPVYEYGFDFSEDLSDAPFYFVDMSTGYATSNYTSLVSNDGNSLVTLGEDTVLSFASNEDAVLAISPDQDGLKDFVAFRGVFLRNYEDFTASVSFLNDLGEEELVWESAYPTSGVKNHFSSNPFRQKSTIPVTSLWMGQDLNGNTVQDGLYTYQISLRPQVPGSITQLLSFDVYVSTTTPTATGADYDSETGLLTLREVENVQPGLNPYRTRVAYGQAPDPLLLQFGLVEDTREYFYLNDHDDYSFYVPDYVDLYSPHTILYLEDYAGNSSEVLLSDILHGDRGVVEFALIEATTGEDLTGAGLRVRIRDAEGNVVSGERLVGQNDQNVRRLPFGTYTAELFLVNEEYFELVGDRVQTFVVSEDNSWQTVAFYVNYIERVNFRVELNQELPQGGAIYLVDSEGHVTPLPATSYVNTVHQSRVRVGEYTLVVDLPEGYTSPQDGMTVTVDSANRSVTVEVERIVTDKSELEVLLQQAEAVNRSQLASGQSLVLDIVLDYAYTVYNDPEALQSQVDDAADALRAQLEVVGAFDELAQDRQAAKNTLAKLSLLSAQELNSYYEQVDAAGSLQEINQVVAEAQALQQDKEEALARLELLETAQAEAAAQINRLENLSEAERGYFVDQVYLAESIEVVNQVLDQALRADAQTQVLAELQAAKDQAVETINDLSNLPETDRQRLLEKVAAAVTVEEVEALVEEAFEIAYHPSNSRGNSGRGNSGNNGNNGRGNNGQGNNSNNGRGNNGNNGRGNNGQGNNSNNGRGNNGNNGRGNSGRNKPNQPLVTPEV